jgi:hypothetical protein
MAEDEFPKPAGFDSLRVPFIFVSDGESAPTEWLTAHPDYIRVPATFAPDAPQYGETGEPTRTPAQPTAAWAHEATIRKHEEVGHAPIGGPLYRPVATLPLSDRSSLLQDHPVSAYLRSNEMLKATEPESRGGGNKREAAACTDISGCSTQPAA